jgi:hypothetical protein
MGKADKVDDGGAVPDERRSIQRPKRERPEAVAEPRQGGTPWPGGERRNSLRPVPPTEDEDAG